LTKLRFFGASCTGANKIHGTMLAKRPILAAIFLFVASSAQAQTMTAEQAKEFVSGGLFSYRCFDGTNGAGRIFTDGSALGSIRVTGRGQTRYMQLPPNTLYVTGSQVCAHLKGLPFEPCFNLVKTGTNSFRGSLSQMSFMYCDFNKGGSVLQLARRRGTGEQKSEHKPAEASSVGGDMQLRR
jgi:hypothetical protein